MYISPLLVKIQVHESNSSEFSHWPNRRPEYIAVLHHSRLDSRFRGNDALYAKRRCWYGHLQPGGTHSHLYTRSFYEVDRQERASNLNDPSKSALGLPTKSKSHCIGTPRFSIGSSGEWSLTKLTIFEYAIQVRMIQKDESLVWIRNLEESWIVWLELWAIATW